ncbi:thiamine phosphate synthase [Candidatus Pelagibacter sp.]|uniref:thiamine phosphate synthase n=1 Tax=Candidatus Pelagibacter sp. TaxID=2024849 RepID=UPI003F84F178
MHDKLLKKYYFINSFDTNTINKQDRRTTFIYRDYKTSKLDTNKILKLKTFLKKRGNKFLLANNFKMALKFKLDGVYLPSFNKKFDHLNYSTYSNFIILGSAHNLKEIKIKETQGVQSIFISSLFKKNNNFLGINKFKLISSYSKKNIIALGGISKKNIKELRLLNISGFAGISFFEQ